MLGAFLSVGRWVGGGVALLMAGSVFLSLAVALFLTIPAPPRTRPRQRRVAAGLLVAGGTALLLTAPFGAMVLVALVCG